MVSFLSFYIVPKRKSQKEPKKYILLLTFPSISDIYQYFYENIDIAGIGDQKDYTVLTSDDVHKVWKDISSNISSSEKRLRELEKYAAKNPDYINEILTLKEFISDLQYTKHQTEFIETLIEGADFYGKIEEICCNIRY